MLPDHAIFHHAPGTQSPELSDPNLSVRLLITFAILMIFLMLSWASYGLMSKRGKSLPLFKLSLLCLSFASCSWGMNVINKALVEILKAPSFVTAAQMWMTVIGTLLLARDKLSGDFYTVLKWSFVPLLFFGPMMVSSFFAYEHLTLSMLMLTRNLGPLITLPIERVVMPPEKQPRIGGKSMLALFIILAGAILYARDAQWTEIGLIFAISNMVLSIADRVVQRRLLTSECKSLSNESIMVLNSLIGSIPTIALGVAVKEASYFNFKLWFFSNVTLLMLLSGFITSGICYFALELQREISAMSFMVLQNASRMAVVIAGVCLFHDPLESWYHAIGLFLSFGGALWYGQIQAKEGTPAKKEEKKKLMAPQPR